MRPLHHLHIRVSQKHCLIAGPCGTTPSELPCFYNKLLDRYDAMMDKLAVAQHKMEHVVLGITLRDRKRNTWIHQETGISNIINAIRKVKQRWAGQIAQLSDKCGTIRATEWTQRDWTRKTRWRDNLTTTVCTSMVKINQAQTPVGSIQGGVPLSRVNANPDDDGDDD